MCTFFISGPKSLGLNLKAITDKRRGLYSLQEKIDCWNNSFKERFNILSRTQTNTNTLITYFNLTFGLLKEPIGLDLVSKYF